VRDHATRDLCTLDADEPVEAVRGRLRAHAAGMDHGGFPVVGPGGELLGVVTRAEILEAPGGTLRDLVKRAPVVIHEDSSLREAVERMVLEGVGRLVVVDREGPAHPRGILSRSDLMGIHRRRIAEAKHARAHLPLGRLLGRRPAPETQGPGR
jgi:CBS domain-containing protein